jgi:hypothetical protein
MWFAIAICAAGYSSNAKADWTQVGAQYRCDGKSRMFELLAEDRSSDDLPEGVTPKTGYREIPQNAPPIVCALGTMSLHASIEVYPPSSHGQGMGVGYVAVRSLSVSDVELFPDSPAFDWSIEPQTPPLTRIRVIAGKPGTVRVDRCYTPDSGGERCDSKEVPVIALARAQADSSRPGSWLPKGTFGHEIGTAVRLCPCVRGK